MHRHKGLVRMRARSYFLIGGDREDLIQEGMIGLFKAVRDFDPGLNVAFRAFAEICITRQIITAIKNATRQKHIPLNSYLPLNTTGGLDDEQAYEGLFRGSEAVDPIEAVLAAERMKYVNDISRQYLTPRESEVLAAYLSGKSYREIAEDLNCPVKAVDNALQRVKRKVGTLAGHDG
jgi:RNA polymerase sporulation-specific sigma factor